MIAASILMPAFNADKAIADAVASVVAQTMKEWELLIIADDETNYLKVLKEHGICDKRIRFAKTHAAGSGASAALNLGRQFASGRVITRLDADDWYEPERLEILTPLAIRYGVAGDNAVAFDVAKKIQIGPWMQSSDAMFTLDPFSLMISPIPFALVFRHDMLPKWDEDLTFAEDVIFNARAFEHVREIPVVAKCLWHYRIHSSSLSHAVALSNRADETYAKLIEECESSRPRFCRLSLQKIFCEALFHKRALNRAFCVAHRSDHSLSFQEFVLNRQGQRCNVDQLSRSGPYGGGAAFSSTAIEI